MRFLADMGISTRTVVWLRSSGHDAVHLSEENLQRLDDEEVLAKARTEGRILLTMDLDFGYLLAVSQEQVPSVVLFRLENESSEVVNRCLMEVIRECASDLEAGAIISASEEVIRMRRLPT
jgi:predicted nuclease of predicted toxin-antitoxin system